jgi:hypothetical protein
MVMRYQLLDASDAGVHFYHMYLMADFLGRKPEDRAVRHMARSRW